MKRTKELQQNGNDKGYADKGNNKMKTTSMEF